MDETVHIYPNGDVARVTRIPLPLNIDGQLVVAACHVCGAATDIMVEATTAYSTVRDYYCERHVERKVPGWVTSSAS